ncbi:MAG TPA: aspartyl/asparaginyl beta-hydroxylase domain-containing protein, partial [Gammaproteobacteria bacterium]|nr:aspartyl/asparaginyl beta-hydroxylase domain-containing protein [Gammaproteobacteria bacterium]
MSAEQPGTNLAALLDRADEVATRGDARAAVSFYQAALLQARSARGLDAGMVLRLRRGQEFIQLRTKEFERTLDQSLPTDPPADAAAALRLNHAIDIVKGTRELYPQQPSMFYYPYLPQRQFFERQEFAWTVALEAATREIVHELRALLSEGADFRPYVERDPERPPRDFHGLTENRSWTALYIWKHGRFVDEIAERCPATVRALEGVPLSRIGSRTPSVFFSRLEPGAHIPPHTGMLNSRLICHLPLIVPAGCTLRVGNETRAWEEGELLIFDDSIEHEARNPTGEVRIV